MKTLDESEYKDYIKVYEQGLKDGLINYCKNAFIIGLFRDNRKHRTMCQNLVKDLTLDFQNVRTSRLESVEDMIKKILEK